MTELSNSDVSEGVHTLLALYYEVIECKCDAFLSESAQFFVVCLGSGVLREVAI